MDMIVGFLFLSALGLFVVHLFRLGTYYIRFDGSSYWVFQRAFMGYDNCMGLFSEERQALNCIEKLKRDPPRVINP